MKKSPLSIMLVTASIIVLILIVAALDIPFTWMFALAIIGQALFVYMAYKVLSSSYKSNKTFEDGYEDSPYKKEEFR